MWKAGFQWGQEEGMDPHTQYLSHTLGLLPVMHAGMQGFVDKAMHTHWLDSS